jgi:hypothetical protein
MPTFDIELMTQINQLFEPSTSSFRGAQSRFEKCSAFPGQAQACTPDRYMNESRCSSNSSGTLVSEEDFHPEAQAHMPADDQVIQPSKAKETASDTRSGCIFAPQPRKSEFNPNAAPFVPSPATILLLESSSPTPTLVEVKQTWQELLSLGSLTTEPSRRHHFARALAVSNRWTFSALCELAQHFCLISAEYEHTASCPGPMAHFAQDVRDAVTSADTEWEPTCFIFQLKKYSLEHFKSYWSSTVRSLTVSPDEYSLSHRIIRMLSRRLIIPTTRSAGPRSIYLAS